MEETTTIKISKKFKAELDKEIIHKSESYEDIIKRLLREKHISENMKKGVAKPQYADSL